MVGLRKFIDTEISGGGIFERVSIPLPSLKNISVIQFKRQLTPDLLCAGLGSDLVEKNAYIKAFVEYIERRAFFEIGVSKGIETTNGIAGHRFRFLAKKTARDELFERDAFLMHWYSQTSFQQILPDSSLPIDSLNETGFEVILGITTLGVQRTTCCFIVDRETKGFVLGLSSGKSLKAETHKAFQEAVINLYFGDTGMDVLNLRNSFSAEGFTSLVNHRTYWLHETELPRWTFQAPTTTVKPMVDLIKPTTVFDASYGPVKIVCVRSPDIFDLHIGKPKQEHLDLLTKRMPSNTSLPSVSDLLPHPIP